ncbi:protein of unknown function [Sterolibacterium denitrificans]|uniref:Uncharacterized protein n=1 Tax=Sterolibacterium denitrificans TaxID=157592 RepID=A0A7Z7HQE9_9PROT|nr:protein of unknown function [Sterolibacterium denitrificans]
MRYTKIVRINLTNLPEAVLTSKTALHRYSWLTALTIIRSPSGFRRLKTKGEHHEND